METKLKFILPLTVCLITGSVGAAIINVDNVRPDGASVSGFSITTSALVSNTRTFSFSQTADLDGGFADDTLTFDLIYKAYTGSTFAAGDVTLGATEIAPNVGNINWHSNAFSAGNTVSLEIANISYIDGEGDETIAFNGFTEIRPTSYGSSPAGDLTYYVGLTGATTIVGDPSFGADLTSNGTNALLYFTADGGPVRLRTLDFQFETVIPEPSSFAMLAGLTGLGFVMLRRRRL